MRKKVIQELMNVTPTYTDLEHSNYITGKKPHYCRIPRCHKKMDWDKSKISSHFIKNHPDISLRSYYCSYIKSETIKTEFQDTDGESLDEDSGFSEFRTPSPHGKGNQLGRKHRSRSRKGEKHINAQIKTEPEDYKNNIAPNDEVEFVANIHHANIPSTSYNSPHNIKKHPHGDDKPRPKSKKLKNMSTDKKTPEKQMATEKDHNEGKKTREKEKETSQNVSDLHDTNETHSKDNGREDGVNNVVGPSSVANDEMDTSEPSDAEKSSGTADEGESASTEKTSTSAEKISQLANSFPPREMTEKSFHVTNEDREMTEQTDHSEHGKGMHGTEEREEVIKTPLQGTADERGSTFLPSEPSDTEKTRNTSSDDREITLMEQESEEQVSSVAESNPPSMQITEQRPHIANEGGGDGKGLHGKDREVILKPVPSGEMAKLKLRPVPYQEIERIFQNKVDSKMRRKCRGCDFDRKSMSHHLRFKRSCKELYSQQELDTLQREARAQRAKEKRKKKEQGQHLADFLIFFIT